ncbi:5'-nucleotidase C-terminal domain-containing protein [Geodermatophilus aquaeductus]|uniref:2',3'-cyclic-nucleotide 2'-phosphodiesterase / 3'-nucleotidase n=1 Tax=Geodermatophilus aquaeductus TaxID=1564161 RepID=A0A521F8E6_9ACTN|nr:5'-nucleotidase C-terminal domain-containing protein [Geodermatophilus aquaeductus]SMO92482.1 2',3'-cyclic-nucleotide 2'-phosphodiesterase / 3'-nucleotidase [Geodermatophilus aquaeductus]
MQRRRYRAAALSAGMAVLAVTAGAATPAAAAPGGPSDELDITLLATTDLHGRVQDWDYFRDARYTESAGYATGLARVGSVVDQVRADKGEDSVLVVDNGDFLQGTPLSYYYARQEPVTETGAEHPMAAAYDAIGYDAQVVGNHEFNYGLDLLQAYTEDVDHPVLGANVVDAATGEPYLQPYTLRRMHVPGHKPVTVGILGLTTPGSAIWDRGNVEGRVEFQDMVEAAERWVPVVDRQADVVVVLSHAGVGGTSSYDPAQAPTENPADVIARTVPGIDAMVVGHTHRNAPSQVVVNEVTGEDVLLTQPYRWGATVSQVDIGLEKVRGQWDVVSTAATALRTDRYPEDPAVLAATADAHARTVEYVNQVVATSAEALPAATSPWEDTPILDFIQDVQTDTVGAALEGTEYADLPVLSIAAPFSRDAVFPQGDVTVRDIAGLYVYDNTLEAVTLTGAQVRAYLEYSARYYRTAPATGAVDPASLTNAVAPEAPNGIPDYNYDQLSGVTYDVDVAQPVGSRIVGLSHDGQPVADDEVFVVAVNNYRRSGGGGFPGISTAPVVYNEQQEIRQLLIDRAQSTGVIDPADFAVENWRLVRSGALLVP